MSRRSASRRPPAVGAAQLRQRASQRLLDAFPDSLAGSTMTAAGPLLGTLTSSRMALNAAYRTRLKLFASSDSVVFDWDRWDESSLTIDGVSYQYAGPAHIQTSFKDGKASGLDDPNAWGADGALLRNGAAWGQLQMRDAGLDIVAEVVTPDGTFEIGRWAKGF